VIDVNLFTLVAALVAGAFSFFSPCVLPLLPGYVSLMSGYSMQELSEGNVSMRRVTGMTGLFVLGFTIVFVGLGAGASAISAVFRQPAFATIAGWVIIIMGLFIAITAVWTPSWLIPVMRERRVEAHSARRFGYLGPPIMGAAFAFGWTPCIGPFLASTLALASTSDTVYQGMLVLFFYSLGLGFPFLLTSLLVAKAAGSFTWVKKHFTAITVFSGLLLALFGVLMLTGQINQLSTYMANFLDWIGLTGLLEQLNLA
jgi:cytochrome c-type biogenesis protein